MVTQVVGQGIGEERESGLASIAGAGDRGRSIGKKG